MSATIEMLLHLTGLQRDMLAKADAANATLADRLEQTLCRVEESQALAKHYHRVANPNAEQH